MKAYIVYTTTGEKEVEIPDKFAPLAKFGGWPDDLWNELDDYTSSEEFSKLCDDIDGDVYALETEEGNRLIQW